MKPEDSAICTRELEERNIAKLVNYGNGDSKPVVSLDAGDLPVNNPPILACDVAILYASPPPVSVGFSISR
jgi:hypothetical protein